MKENESNTLSSEKSKDEKVFECDICTYKTKSENGIKIHKAKKHTYPCRNCNQTFTDQDVYSNHITECYRAYSYYDSPMRSPVRFPHRFPPRYPHASPQRYPPTFPPQFPRSPLYWVTETIIQQRKRPLISLFFSFWPNPFVAFSFFVILLQ